MTRAMDQKLTLAWQRRKSAGRSDINMEFVEFPKSYAAGIAISLIALTITLLIAVYFYMQASLTD